MAMNTDTLTELIATKMRREMYNSSDDADMGSDVLIVPLDDGTIRYQETPRKGRPDIDLDKLRPMARAIAEAVVEHVRSSAEAVDLVAGATWRIL